MTHGNAIWCSLITDTGTMKTHYVSAFIAEAFTQVGMIATFFLIGTFISPVAVLEYAFIRRILSLLFPLCILGFDTGLARYGWQHREKITSLIFFAFAITLFILGITAAVILPFQEQFSKIMFGSESYTRYIVPLLILILGDIFYAITYNAYRGILHAHTANILLFLSHGFAPVVLVFLFSSLDSLLLQLGLVWIVLSLCFLIPLVMRYHSPIDISTGIRLFSFGLRRFPADFLQISFFSLPVLISAHIWGSSLASQFAIGISLLGMAGSAFSPFNVVFLPHIAKLIHERSALTILKRSFPYIAGLLGIIGILLILSEIFIYHITAIIFHSTDPKFIILLRILLIGILPYCIYCTAKSILDVQKDGSLNSRNMTLALIFFLIQSMIGILFHVPIGAMALFMITSLILLALLTISEVKKFMESNDI